MALTAASQLQDHSFRSRRVTVKVPAMGGELWRGFLPGRLTMVNCPICMKSSS